MPVNPSTGFSIGQALKTLRTGVVDAINGATPATDRTSPLDVGRSVLSTFADKLLPDIPEQQTAMLRNPQTGQTEQVPMLSSVIFPRGSAGFEKESVMEGGTFTAKEMSDQARVIQLAKAKKGEAVRAVENAQLRKQIDRYLGGVDEDAKTHFLRGLRMATDFFSKGK